MMKSFPYVLRTYSNAIQIYSNLSKAVENLFQTNQLDELQFKNKVAEISFYAWLVAAKVVALEVYWTILNANFEV